MAAKRSVTFTDKPDLRTPDIICGMTGWVDGGEAATGAIEYLARKLDASKLGRLPLEPFRVYQVPGEVTLRPLVKIEDGLLKEHWLPHNDFYYCINARGPNDVILLLGAEPNLNWQEYCDAILHVAGQFGAGRVFMLGGVLDKTPYSKEPNVACTCSSREMKEEIAKYGVQFNAYEGPGSFGTYVVHACQKRRLPAVTMMVRAAYYPEFNILVPRNPKSTRALVSRLDAMLNLGLDLADLDAEAKDFEEKLAFVASQNPDFRTYVADLEKEYNEVVYQPPLEMSGDEAVRIAEELLKRGEDQIG